MAGPRYYRGGNSLAPRSIDIRIDRATGLLRPDHGVSIQDIPEGLERFGGAYEVTNIPAEIHVIKTGRNPHHYELAPARPMTRAEYEDALSQVILVPGSFGRNE